MAPIRTPRKSRRLADKALRLRMIELAANYHADTTPETVARASAYLEFVKRGPVMKPPRRLAKKRER